MLPCLPSGLVKIDIVGFVKSWEIVVLLVKSWDSNRLNLRSTGSLLRQGRREKLEAGILAKGYISTKTAIKLVSGAYACLGNYLCLEKQCVVGQGLERHLKYIYTCVLCNTELLYVWCKYRTAAGVGWSLYILLSPEVLKLVEMVQSTLINCMDIDRRPGLFHLAPWLDKTVFGVYCQEIRGSFAQTSQQRAYYWIKLRS